MDRVLVARFDSTRVYFLVGVAVPFSIAARRAQGQEFADLLRHALVRALVLIVLGMVLVSLPQRRWVWWFDDTLTQIGLAYPFVCLPPRVPACARPRRCLRGGARRLLAVVRAVPAAAGGFRLQHPGRTAGMVTAAPIERLYGALAKLHQSGRGFRPVVVESLSTQNAVPRRCSGPDHA